LPAKADKLRIQPLYEELHDAVRAIDSDKLLFYESLPVNLYKVGFTSLPGSIDKKSVLSWHFYWNPIGKDAFITARIQESKRLSVVPFASEFDITWDGSLRKNLEIDQGGLNVNDSLNTMKRLDSELISWNGWEYKTYIKKTGYGEGIFDSINQNQRPIMKTLYSRPYAQAVSGTISEMKYDDDSGTFTLNWTVAAFSATAPTIVSTGRAWHYPNGFSVSITPATIQYAEKGNLLYIPTLRRSYPQTFRLVIKRK
jgi:endoglycosylceramidase